MNFKFLSKRLIEDKMELAIMVHYKKAKKFCNCRHHHTLPLC